MGQEGLRKEQGGDGGENVGLIVYILLRTIITKVDRGMNTCQDGRRCSGR